MYRKELEDLIAFQEDLKLIKTHKYDQTIENIENNINQYNTLEGYTIKGVAYLEKNDFAGAIECFTKALKFDEKNINVISYLGFTYLASGNIEAAQDQFSKIIKIDPKNLKMELINVDLLRQLKKFHEAESILLKLNQNYANNDQVISGLIELKLDQNLNSDAQNYANILKSLEVTDIELQLEIVQRLIQAKLEEYALNILNNILSKNDKNSKAWYSLAIIQNNQNKYKEAINSFKKVIEIDPNNITAKIQQAFSYGQLQEFENALQIFQELLQQNSSNSEIFNSMGIIYSQQKQFEQAQEYFDKALQINQKNPLYKINKALLLMQTNKEEGLKLLQEAKDLINPDLEKNQLFTSSNIQFMRETFSKFEKNKNDSILDGMLETETKIMETAILPNFEEQQIENNNKLINMSCFDYKKNINYQTELENARKDRYLKQRFQLLENQARSFDERIKQHELLLKEGGIATKVSIKTQLNEFKNSKEGQKQLVYYETFYWTLYKYIEAYLLSSTRVIQNNTNQIIETRAEKVVDSVETGLDIGVRAFSSVPVISSIFQVIHFAVQKIFEIYKDNKHQQRVNVINKLIQKKIFGNSDLELQIQIAAIELSKSRKDVIMNKELIQNNQSQSQQQDMQGLIKKLRAQQNYKEEDFCEIGFEDAVICLGYLYNIGPINSQEDLSQQIITIVQKRGHNYLPKELESDIQISKSKCCCKRCQIQ